MKTEFVATATTAAVPGFPRVLSSHHPQKSVGRVGLQPADGNDPARSAGFRECWLQLSERVGAGCALRLERKIEQLPGVRRVTVNPAGAAVSITHDGSRLPQEELVRRLREMGVPVTDVVGSGPRVSLVDIGLVAGSLVFTLVGMWLALSGAAGWLVGAACALSYLNGGYLLGATGLRSLRHHTLDARHLTILAAIGAACLGLPLAGAVLLTLHALTLLLQSVVLTRVRSGLGMVSATGGQGSASADFLLMIREARSEKSDTQRVFDGLEQWYVGGVLLAAAVLGWHDGWLQALSFMVAVSPGALLLATPVANLCGAGGAAGRGIGFKDGGDLERLAAAKVVVFDQAGTLTPGRLRITDFWIGGRCHAFASTTQVEVLALLRLAAAVLSGSEESWGRAILEAARSRRLGLPEASELEVAMGQHTSAMVSGRRIVVGTPAYFETVVCKGLANTRARIWAEGMRDQGMTCVVVAEVLADGAGLRIVGVITLTDPLRPEANAVIATLHKSGIRRVVMLTGEDERVARAIARDVGVDEFYASLSQHEKVAVVRALKSLGPVVMVGNGVKDPGVLASADIGIAVGPAGAEKITETADVVLPGDGLGQVVSALRISRQVRRMVALHLILALGGVVGAVALVLLGAISLTTAAFIQQGMVVLICLNGLRIFYFPDDFDGSAG